MLRVMLLVAAILAAAKPRTSKDVLVARTHQLFSSIGLIAGVAVAAAAPMPTSKVESAVVLVPGYKLPLSCYSSWLTSFQQSGFKCYCYQADTTSLTVSEEAAAVAEFSKCVSPRGVALVGHSRGGAVSAKGALLLGKACKGVLLVDPVDDLELSALSALASSPALYPPTLTVSCPYGGVLSKYYKTSLSSSCAPSGRNAHAFQQVLQAKAEGVNHSFSILEGVGHLQLLDQGALGDLFFSGLCAANPDIEVAASKKRFLVTAVSFLRRNLVEEGRR